VTRGSAAARAEVTDRASRYRDECWLSDLEGPIVSLLVTGVGVFLGIAYARFVDRRFGPEDWRRWVALAPAWALAVGMALALDTLNVRDLAPRAIQAFAIGSFGEAVVDSLSAVRRRRVARRDERVAPPRGQQHASHSDPS
jgi:hypothetical protein